MLNKIVSQYIENGKLMAMLSTYVLSDNKSVDQELRYDFIHEIALYLLEYKHPEKIIKMYEENRLDYFIMKIIRIQATSNNCKWHKLYGNYEKRKILSI